MRRISDPDIRKRNLRRRLWFYGTLAFAAWVGWHYVPYRIQYFQPEVPKETVQFPADRFLAKGTRVAIVTAHPDDAEFYLGGTLTRLAKTGADIQLIVCTDGDKRNYFLEDWKKTGEIRRGEQIEASKVWKGRYPVFLGFPDGGTEVDEPMIRAIGRELVRFDPQFTLIFDGDYFPKVSHGDHVNAGKAAELAMRMFHVKGWVMRFASRGPNWFSDISDVWDAKSDLLAIHRSQFYGDKLERIRGTVEAMGEKEGEIGGVNLAEGFRCDNLTP
jgi:LmbE family N-acetylglucosaminyl deacetylase